jgi:Kef-type K+ transport system membrane component KefB
MGGASSWYAMLTITGFLIAVWLAGRISRVIGMSSIVLEVGTGLILGPNVLGLIPGELSECWEKRYVDCNQRKFQAKIADKGTYYCDLDAYQKENRYVTGNQQWYEGFFGNIDSVELGEDKKKKTYCLHPAGCTAGSTRWELTEGGRLLGEQYPSMYPANASKHDDERALLSRRMADQEGKTKYDSYNECLEKSCDLDRALQCATIPDIFSLVGHTGVAMMIFESGMHFDFAQARVVGPWASAVAILGTFIPVATGLGLSLAFGFDFLEGLAAGVTLAPTSVGIALKLLHEAKALHLYFGQAVMTAAFVDDVLSLILFSVLFSLGNIEFWPFFRLGCGLLFMAITIVAAVKVWPPLLSWLFSKVPEDKPDAKVTRHDEVMWIVMLLTLLVYGQITHECGTHLWGAFIAGMSFSTQHHAHHVWVRQVKRSTVWWLRIFFACTLAWSIPVEDLFSPQALWQGTIMGIGPCILSKVLCAPFMGKAKWVIGWAMVGRAEFAYFIAIMAQALQMIPDKLFAILLWALIWATIFAPLIFRKVLVRYMLTNNIVEVDSSAEIDGGGESFRDVAPGKSGDETEQSSAPRKIASTEQITGHRGSIGGAFDMHAQFPDKIKEKKEQERMESITKLRALEKTLESYEDVKLELREANNKLADFETTKEQLTRLQQENALLRKEVGAEIVEERV